MKMMWQCLYSPRLYKIYHEGSTNDLYEAHGLEKWGDKVISSANTILNIAIYSSPFIFMYILKRGLYSLEEIQSMSHYFTGIGCLLTVSFLMRAYGRASNPKYMEFVRALSAPMTDKNAYLNGIRKFDFEFSAWPVTYFVPPKKSSWFENNPFSSTINGDLPSLQRTAVQGLAFIAVHTFGLRLVYPGTLGLIQSMLWAPLFQGRTMLVEGDSKRAKIQTAEANEIDTMFTDNRNKSVRGNTLVICCEGNSGFYEIGIMQIPVKCGYSALGWNHPGFAGSTGLPYPTQEKNAIDAVLQYAINELEFKPEDIVVFGWSIGGYTSTWAAVNYPVKGLILDATFDDLLPLAERHMPSWWSVLVREVVRTYIDLNIGEMLMKYKGPVKIVRRTEDEIISLMYEYLTKSLKFT